MSTAKKHIAAIFASLALSANAAGISEAEVFEWWDDETIGAEEANEILSLIDEGNMEQACALAGIYANHPCEAEDEKRDGIENVRKSKKMDGRKQQYHIAATSKVRFDSTGTLDRHREEIRFTFHNFTLSLGNHELLTYKSRRGEAHFGQIATRELHSEIPLDTLWGTAVIVSFKKIESGFLLDTSGTASALIAIGPFRKVSAKAAYWYGDSGHTHSVSLSLAFPSGLLAAWYQAGQAKPLLYFRLHGKDSSAFSWRTTGYLHGSDIPEQARLSTSIVAHKFWTSQSVSFRAKEFFDTKVTASARIASPLFSDSVSGRFALDMEGGPPTIRINAKATCREASENCRQTIYQGTAGYTHDFGSVSTTLSGSARTQHDRAESSWSRPRLEIGATITEKDLDRHENMFKLSLVAPDTRPRENIQIRSETRLTGNFLEFSIIAAFRKKDGGKVRPSHAQLSSKIAF